MEKTEDAFGAAGANLPLHRPLCHGMTFVLGTKSEVQIDERDSKRPLQHYRHSITRPPLLLWAKQLHFDQRERNQQALIRLASKNVK